MPLVLLGTGSGLFFAADILLRREAPMPLQKLRQGPSIEFEAGLRDFLVTRPGYFSCVGSSPKSNESQNHACRS